MRSVFYVFFCALVVTGVLSRRTSIRSRRVCPRCSSRPLALLCVSLRWPDTRTRGRASRLGPGPPRQIFFGTASSFAGRSPSLPSQQVAFASPAAKPVAAPAIPPVARKPPVSADCETKRDVAGSDVVSARERVNGQLFFGLAAVWMLRLGDLETLGYLSPLCVGPCFFLRIGFPQPARACGTPVFVSACSREPIGLNYVQQVHDRDECQ